MYKIVFDADGLLKVYKGGFLVEAAAEHVCLMPDEVFQETVVAARRTHADEASALEELVRGGGLLRRPPARSAQAEQVLAMSQALGRGESGALRLFFKERADVIVTDDRAFLNLLLRNQLPFLTPAHLLVRLRRAGRLSGAEAVSAAARLRPLIRGEVYQDLVQQLGEFK
jgi:hypothetical protein